MQQLDVLLVGSGGREHALAWKLAQSPAVGRIFVAPGNAGSERVAQNVPIAAGDIGALRDFAVQRRIGLTIVGPEVPLAAGIGDLFAAAGLALFGPTQAAAQLESSKAFSKAFMQRHNIPTAAFATFTEFEKARLYLEALDTDGVVIKASGLAAGKGVYVCDDREQALQALQALMVARQFGAAGDEVVIEERLRGPELSLLAFCDGRTVVPLTAARDHKRAYDGDEGPNTGGMGAYAPPPDVDEHLLAEITQDVLQRTVDAMAAEHHPYSGVLYAGLMLTENGPRVLEFNCRFGDPETQVLLPLLDCDLLHVILACVEQRLTAQMVRLKPEAAATVVMASAGYPGSYQKGKSIAGIEQAEALAGVTVFHAGTRRDGGQIVTDGGRVLAVSAVGADCDRAIERAYQGVAYISFDGAHFRRDIGRQRDETTA